MQRWPVFNVADSSVVCGMIIMSAFVIFGKAHHAEEAETPNMDTPTKHPQMTE
jgi:lipoprotein signal peptidase